MDHAAINIDALLFHLKKCPADFLQPAIGFPSGVIHTTALIADVYRNVWGNVAIDDAALPAVEVSRKLTGNEVVSIHIGAWFFFHPFFLNQPRILPGVQEFLFTHLPEVSRYVNAAEWIEEEDRAEEFVRLALRCCGLLPAGETAEEAADRLEALNTLKRREVLHQTAESLQRIKEIRQKMAEAKAREAANVYGRE